MINIMTYSIKCVHGGYNNGYDCVECKGGGICEHLMRRRRCPTCGGSGRCIHGKEKDKCGPCGGSGWCQEHNCFRQFCVECNGISLCIHKNIKGKCKECPIEQQNPNYICKICCSTLISGTRRRLAGMCAGCERDVPRTEIVFGNMIVKEIGYEPTYKDETLTKSSICKGVEKRRPDLCWIVPNKVAIVVEIDEDSHYEYNSSCEMKKISEQNLAIQLSPDSENVPVFTFRVNPDVYDRRRVTLEDRAKIIGKMFNEILTKDYERNGYQKIFYCFYHTKSQYHIDVQKEYIDCDEIM
jgi:hypothetical protein